MARGATESSTSTHNRLFQAEVYLLIGMGIVLRAAKYLPGWSSAGRACGDSQPYQPFVIGLILNRWTSTKPHPWVSLRWKNTSYTFWAI